MPDERGPQFAYAPMAPLPDSPEILERRKASEMAYAEARAAGKSESEARIAAAKADARVVRAQLKLQDDPETVEYEQTLAERWARSKSRRRR
jgi:hypothetical protein